MSKSSKPYDLYLGLFFAALFGLLLVGVLIHRARQFDRIFQDTEQPGYRDLLLSPE